VIEQVVASPQGKMRHVIHSVQGVSMNPKVFDMTPQGHLYNSGPFSGVPGRNKKQLRESTEQHEQPQ